MGQYCSQSSPFCNSKVRSISKQASIKRKADRDKNCIRAALIHQDLQSLSSLLYTDCGNCQDIVNEITLLEKKCRSAETASSSVVSEDLSEKLAIKLENFSAHTENNAR